MSVLQAKQAVIRPALLQGDEVRQNDLGQSYHSACADSLYNCSPVLLARE